MLCVTVCDSNFFEISMRKNQYSLINFLLVREHLSTLLEKIAYLWYDRDVKTVRKKIERKYNMKKMINKLVRDNIPSICEKNGQTPETKILDDENYTSALKTKLKEEVEEFLVDNNTEELADIIEVIEALAENQGISLNEVMAIKQHKQNKNGAFRNKVFLISVDC